MTTHTNQGPLERNLKMPFMRFNWATHDTWCNHMTLEERGLFDAVRCVLWTVVGCKMPIGTLRVRLNIKQGGKSDKLLMGLIAKGSLSFSDGRVFDEVQVSEFDQSVAKGKVNTTNGSKGGRPRSSKALPPAVADQAAHALNGDPSDF
jgi:hypothetical protein